MVQPNSNWSLEPLRGGRTFRHQRSVGESWGACCRRQCWQPSRVAPPLFASWLSQTHLPVCHTFAVTCCHTKDNKAKQPQSKTSETRKNSTPPTNLSFFNLGILSQYRKVNNLTQSLVYDRLPQNLPTVQGYENIIYSVQLHFTV